MPYSAILSARWREQLDLVTELAVRRHSLDDTDPEHAPLVDVLDTQLDAARQLLADIEAALQQVDAGSPRKEGVPR